MHRAGFANQPVSVSRDDGLRLNGAFVAAAVRCAPPANKPLPAERDNCLPYAREELDLLEPCGDRLPGRLRLGRRLPAALDQAEAEVRARRGAPGRRAGRC